MTTERTPPTEPAPGVRLPDAVRVAAGAAAILSVDVTNTAAERRQLTVLALGVDQGWLPGPAVTGVLEPGESATVEIRLTPTAGTLPAKYPVAVTVQALVPGTGRAAPAPSGIGESTLVVNPRAQLQLEVTPEQATLIRSQRIRIGLRNGGPTASEAEIESTATKGLEVRLRRRSVAVPAGGEVRLKGRLVATRPKLFGGGTQHSWTVTAAGPDVVRRARGTVQQRAVLGPAWLRAAALLAVLAVWVAAAVVFIPRLADRFGGQDDTVTAVTGEHGEEGEDGDGGDDDGSEGSGSDEGVKVTQAKSPATPTGLQLNGTVTADEPGGVTVTLEPTSLVDEDVEGAEIASELVSLVGYGKTPQSALLVRAADEVPRTRTATTTADGTWSFLKVAAPGYYLATFSKPGYDTQRHVIDSSTVDTAEPLEIELEPGDGSLSGRVIDARGRPVGAAKVAITDGTSTLTTSSSSGDGAGGWSVSGLSTPGSYLVEVSSFGLGTESRLVELDAGGRATADFRLRPGVTALVGKVEGTVPGGRFVGIGGVTVTVADSHGEQRSATTVTTKNLVGHYRLTGLPSPGTYTVTMSADGYQTQTSEVTLKDAQSKFQLDAELVANTGVVAGTVRVKGTDKRVPGAGLVLSDGVNTYKTTSTSRNSASGDKAGAFSFDGVEPGTYQLTTEYFEYVTNVLTIRVRAGRPSDAQPRIRVNKQGVLPASSRIKGMAVDKYSNDAVSCEAAEPCTATIIWGADGAPGGQTDPYTADFVTGEEYLLPSDDDIGLEPGLYTVEVTAPGYESARVRVQVPLRSTAIAPTAELTRLPTITGTIRVARGSPEAGAQTCVWAVPFGTPTNVGTCAAAKDDTCRPAGEARTTRAVGTVCEYGDALEAYLLELPTAGTYRLIAKMDDLAYSPIEVFPVNVAPGGTSVQNLEFMRKAEIQVVTHTLDANGTPTKTDGVNVTLERVNADTTTTPVPGDPKVSDSGGSVRFVGLDAGTYRATGWKDGLRLNRGETQVEINQAQTVHLTLGDVPQPFVIQVVSDNNVAVDNATVEVTAPGGYDGTDPVQVTEQATTVVPAADSDRDGCVVFHDAGAAVTALAPCNDTFAAVSRTEASFASGWADRIRVTAPGYEDLVTTRRMMTSVMQLRLDPSPVRFASSVTAEGAQPAFQEVTFSVTSSTTPTGTISVSADGNGTIVWNDTRYPTGVIRPGTYTITASAAGYVSGPVTFRCDVGVDCTPAGPVLRELGSLTVKAVEVDATGGSTQVDDVTVTLFKDGHAVGSPVSSASDQNSVSFPALVPGAAGYTIRVQAAGYQVGSGALTCTRPPSPPEVDPVSTDHITVAAGITTTCTAALTRLARITGTVTGVLADPSATPDPGADAPPERALAGAKVTATRCTEWHPSGAGQTPTYCTKEDNTQQFPAITGPDGSFTIAGTKVVEGMTEGVWLLRGTQPGWSTVRPSGGPTDALLGVVVQVVGSADVSTALRLYADPVQFDVRVNDQRGDGVEGATVQLLRSGSVVQTADAAGAGTYRFANAIPGGYTVRVTGMGLVESTAQFEIQVNVATQSFTMPVTRAANTLTGTVVDGSAAVGGVKVTVHSCASETAPCGDAVAKGTDGKDLEFTTGTDGRFQFRNVPNGWFQVRFHLRKYEDAVAGPFEFHHTLGPVALTVTMVKVLRNVTVAVATVPTGTSLSGTKVELKSTDATVNPISMELSGSSVTNQVPYGCWNIVLTLPSGHYGTVETTKKSHPDGTCSGDVVVGAGGGNSAVTADVSVVESKVSLPVTAVPVTGHPAPTTARLAVTGITLDNDEVVIGGGAKEMWLPPGSYDVTATALGLSADQRPFWPAVTKPLSVSRGDPAMSLDLDLTEQLGEATITTREAGAPPTAVAGTITVTRGLGQGAAVPAAYATPVATDGVVTLTLPSGRWSLVATATDGRTLPTVELDLVQLSQPLTIPFPAPPP